MKKILTDVDGCLLYWEEAFHEWMQVRAQHPLERRDTYYIEEMYPSLSQDEAQYFIREFGNSSWMGFLDPVRDAQQGVAKLVESGYVFDCITSLSKDPYTGKLRTMNLENCFGKEAFDQFVYLDTGEDKTEALSKYKGTGYYWIEDKPANCEVGLSQGLQPIIIDHPHNQGYENPNVFRVTNWSEIVDIIVNEKSCK